MPNTDVRHGVARAKAKWRMPQRPRAERKADKAHKEDAASLEMVLRALGRSIQFRDLTKGVEKNGTR